MPTPSIQTLVTDAQQVLNLDSISAVRSVVAVALANANTGTPLNPNLTTQQLWNEFYQVVTKPKSDIESIIANQLMKFLFAPPAPGGVGANKQVIFNDGGVLAGAANLYWDKVNNRVGIGTASPTAALDIFGAFGTSTAAAVLRNNSAFNNSNIVETQYFAVNSNTGLDCIGKFGAVNPAATGNNYGQFYWQIANAGSPTTAMTLNSTGLGVGTTNFAYKLNAAGFIAAVDPSFTGTGGSLIGAMLNNDNATPGLDLRRWTGTAGTHGTTYIATDSSGATFFYNGQQASNTKATSLKMTLDASGNLSLANGNLVMGTSGKGIDFSATPNSSGTMTSELLSDYEEGTFVATLKGSVSDPTTPVTALARYTKIGREVKVSIFFANVNTTGASGNLRISGLPFVSANDSIGTWGAATFYNAATFTGYAISELGPNTTIMEFPWTQSNGVSGYATHNAGANRYVSATLMYNV